MYFLMQSLITMYRHGTMINVIAQTCAIGIYAKGKISCQSQFLCLLSYSVLCRRFPIIMIITNSPISTIAAYELYDATLSWN